MSRKNKVFRDNVHGYISIPEDYVHAFIDTELFQRLRTIEQTGMRILYPSARHDRFSHSLGVYHLGSKAFQCFKENVKSSYGDTHYSVKNDGETTEKFWDYCQTLFEIACLLHDCGHAPFSHTLEYFYDIESKDTESLKDKLINYLGSKEFAADFRGQGAPHERMSALLVCTEYQDAVDEILTKYNLNGIGEKGAVEFISRMIIGCQYGNATKENQIKNCFISLLNSNSIDVDSLDYIVRDAKMSGIDNMSIDIDRLLSSLTLVEITTLNKVELHNREIAATVLEGELTDSSGKATFSGKLDGFLEARDSCQATFQGTVGLDGNLKILNEVKITDGKQYSKIVNCGGASLDKIATMKEPARVKLQGVLGDNLKVEGSSISLQPFTSAQVRLSANSIHFSSSYIDGGLTGSFTGKLLGNHGNIPKAEVECTLGFHKSSLSVIQNVIIARNYEYQWIYSHHKVVYYANYLLIELLRKSVKFFLCQNSPDTGVIHATDCIAQTISWKTMVSKNEHEPQCGSCEVFGMKFWRPTDADLLSLFKRCQVETELMNNTSSLAKTSAMRDASELIHQYITRNYRKSLWKSYAEMCDFFSGFTQEEISNILDLLIDNSDYRLNDKYGYLSEEWQKAFYSFGLDDVVWVNGDSKLKELSPDETFIHFKTRDMTYGSVSSPNVVKPMLKYDLFYIYYQPVDAKPVNGEGLVGFFREQLDKARQD